MRITSSEPIKLPLLALRGLCVFTGVVIHFDVGRPKSVKALDEAMKEGQLIFLVAQKDMKTDDPQLEDLHTVGTISRIKQILRLPGESSRVLVEGIQRATIEEIVAMEPYPTAMVRPVLEYDENKDPVFEEALIRIARDVFDEYASLLSKVSQDIMMTVIDAKEPGELADYLAANLPLRLSDKQAVLEEFDPKKRLQTVVSVLRREIEIIILERDIQSQTREQIEKSQREYYLREQMKTIQTELGDGDNLQAECEEYEEKIRKLKVDEKTAEKLYKEVGRLLRMSYASSEATVIRSYLDACLEIPWGKTTKDRLDLERAKKILDEDHFGLSDVKERIVEFLAVKQLKPDLKGQILCLVGPPGTGKTSIAKSIARSLGRKYARLSLGGVRDEADIRGHRKTYIGAMPGRIIGALRQAGTQNPVILLDEIDKMSSDYRGDPTAALLEVLDTEQNTAFADHYIELPVDLSNVLFITTANRLDTISRPLLDRMDVIELTSYTTLEKLEIAKRHLLPKQQKLHGIARRKMKIDDETMLNLIGFYTRESGVRTLERRLATLCRKSAAMLVSGNKTVAIDDAALLKMLGPKKYNQDALFSKDEVGIICGLAWTQTGGELLFIEVNIVEGTGKIELTGQLGDVMKESAQAAISYIRSRAGEFDIDKEFYKKFDIHIHFPEGAVPKDGPSAGIAIVTALVSALTGAPVRRDIAMTGETTIRGRVLPIGGLKEKTMAAHRAGIKTVIIPEDNVPDLDKIDETVRGSIKFIAASHIDDVLPHALLRPNKKRSLIYKKPEEKVLPVIEDAIIQPEKSSSIQQ